MFQVEPDELRRLSRSFRKLDSDGSGTLSVKEFMDLPELHNNPLARRVIDLFDTNNDGEVDFKGRRLFFLETKKLIKAIILRVEN